MFDPRWLSCRLSRRVCCGPGQASVGSLGPSDRSPGGPWLSPPKPIRNRSAQAELLEPAVYVACRKGRSGWRGAAAVRRRPEPPLRRRLLLFTRSRHRRRGGYVRFACSVLELTPSFHTASPAKRAQVGQSKRYAFFAAILPGSTSPASSTADDRRNFRSSIQKNFRCFATTTLTPLPFDDSLSDTIDSVSAELSCITAS